MWRLHGKKEKDFGFDREMFLRIDLGLYLALSLIYTEIVLLLGNLGSITPLALLYIVLFDGSLGVFLSFLFTLSNRRRLNAILTIVFLSLHSVYFCIQYFCKVFFLNYMTPESIFLGAGGVMGDFFDTIVQLVIKGLGMILLFFLPLIGFILLWKFHRIKLKKILGWKKALTGGVAVILFLCGFLIATLHEASSLRYEHNFEYDTATASFGLVTSTRLDLQYLIFGNSSASSFEVVEEEPSEEEPEETQEPEETVIVYGQNILNIDFAALAEGETNSSRAAIDTYVASLTASSQNEYTGLFAGKNLILITAEAFSLEAIDQNLTPTLYRLANSGIQFTNYYQPAWGGSTSSGEYSILTGLVPTYGVKSIQKTIGNNMYYTMGNQLQRLSYYSVAFHNHTNTYYSRNETHTNLGYSSFIARGSGLEDYITSCWPESDLEMMQTTVDWYIDNQPFSVYYMTVSGHANYSWTGNSMSSKNKSAVIDVVNASSGVQAYIAAQLEFEYAMEYLVSRLEEAGIADDTVIVITADHYPFGLADCESDTYSDALAELYGYSYSEPWDRDHNALIIWSGCLEDMDPIVVDTPVYSLDIIPTLSNLFGLEYDSRLMVGRDVFSDQEPLVIWANYSWMTEKACYNASTGVYTVFEGYEDEVDSDYKKRITTIVKNKVSYSKNVLDTNWFYYIFGEDTYQ